MMRRQFTPPRLVGYDTLISAIGSITNDFGTPGVAENAVPLETRRRRRASIAATIALTHFGISRAGLFRISAATRGEPTRPRELALG